MNPITRTLSPGATDMIRADHSHVFAAFHRYSLQAAARTKRGLADHICLAVEVHARIEEELFYPALREAGSQVVEKSFPEHEEMRRLMEELRRLDAAAAQFDAVFMDLMRTVIHHVADEETVLLPEAESVLGERRLKELGARMMKRRLELMRPRTGALVLATARAVPPKAMLVGAGALLAGALALRRFRRHA